MYIFGKSPPSSSWRCGAVRSTRILTVGHLPAPYLDSLLPEAHACRHHRVDSTKSLLLLLLLSCFSRVQLCVTPWMAAHQAPPSLGFSRQEHWSGLPFPSPMHGSEKWKWSHSVMCDSSLPHGLQPTRLLCPWDFAGKSTGVGCHCLLLLNLWFSFIHLQKESLRLGTSSSPWNQDQQHEDDFPGSWLAWSCSLHTHTPFPSSSLLVTSHVLSDGAWLLRV